MFHKYMLGVRQPDNAQKTRKKYVKNIICGFPKHIPNF